MSSAIRTSASISLQCKFLTPSKSTTALCAEVLTRLADTTGSISSASVRMCSPLSLRTNYEIILSLPPFTNTMQTDVATFLILIRDMVGSNLGWDTQYTDNFYGFPQFLQANARIVLGVGHDGSLQNPFRFVTFGHSPLSCRGQEWWSYPSTPPYPDGIVFN
jgi:hypothetical protein